MIFIIFMIHIYNFFHLYHHYDFKNNFNQDSVKLSSFLISLKLKVIVKISELKPDPG